MFKFKPSSKKDLEKTLRSKLQRMKKERNKWLDMFCKEHLQMMDIAEVFGPTIYAAGPEIISQIEKLQNQLTEAQDEVYDLRSEYERID